MEQPWTKSPPAILAHFGVDPKRGNSTEQALKSQKKYGKNGA
jgi:P-type Ca2+ transporter type 2A